MKNKIFMIFIIMVIIFISGCSKKLTQPELNEIYNRYGVHLDQITKFDDDTYGIAFTEKELCNKDWNEINLQINAYCSLHAKMNQFDIYNIKTKQVCMSSNSMTVSGVSIYNDEGICDTTKSYIDNNSSRYGFIQLIKDNKKYIDSYQGLSLTNLKHNVSNNDASNQDIPTLAENGLYDGNANGFVWEGMQNDWTKTHQKSLNLVNYDDTANGMKNNIIVTCFSSINEVSEAVEYTKTLLAMSNYTFTDISYSGLDSETYVKGYSRMFIAKVHNCIINMKIEPEAQDNLDAEVKHLQHINELNK